MSGVLLASNRAGAVETHNFGLATTDAGTAIIVGPGSGPVTEQFELYNLTKAPITIDLGVVSARYDPATKAYLQGSGATGFAAGIHLPASSVTLAAKQTRVLSLSISRPADAPTKQYAELTAEQAVKLGPGINTVQQLALLVILEPNGVQATSSQGDLSARHIAIVIAIALIALAVIGLIAAILMGGLRRQR